MIKNIIVAGLTLLLIGCNTPGIPSSGNNSSSTPETSPIEPDELVVTYERLEIGQIIDVSIPYTETIWDPNAIRYETGILCNDGTRSYSTSRSGTCSSHGGVYSWEYTFTIYGDHRTITKTRPGKYYISGTIYNEYLGKECYITVFKDSESSAYQIRMISQQDNQAPEPCGVSGYYVTLESGVLLEADTHGWAWEVDSFVQPQEIENLWIPFSNVTDMYLSINSIIFVTSTGVTGPTFSDGQQWFSSTDLDPLLNTLAI